MYIYSLTKAELISLIKLSVTESVQKMRNEINTTMPVHDSDYCTIQTVTENVKVTKATVHNWAKTGRIRKYKIGGRTLFKVSELENLITNKI